MQTRQALAKIYCSEDLTPGLDKQIICLSVFNTVLAITAVVGNTMILIALHKETSLHRASTESIKLRIAWECLVFDTDFYVYDAIEESRPRKVTNVDTYSRFCVTSNIKTRQAVAGIIVALASVSF